MICYHEKNMNPKTADDELRMNSKEFDRIMRGALSAPIPKITRKDKPRAKKRKQTSSK